MSINNYILFYFYRPALGSFYPAKLATADAPFLMRDVRGSVVRLHPFQYNPVTGILRVYKKMKVEVSFSGTDDRNVPTGIRHTIDQSMEELFRKMFINYDVMAVSSVNMLPKNAGGDKGAKHPPVLPQKMLIICCDSFATDMSSFITHKQQNKGFSPKLVTMSQVGTTASSVASYILNEYSTNNDLTYVLLVGDGDRVPTILRTDGICDWIGASDLSYALVDGNDSVPDIYVGRFSARNRSEVQTMVARTIYYENNIYQSWQRRSIGIADAETCCYNY